MIIIIIIIISIVLCGLDDQRVHLAAPTWYLFGTYLVPTWYLYLRLSELEPGWALTYRSFTPPAGRSQAPPTVQALE